MIYFVRSADRKLIKIGHTKKRVRNRLSGYASEYPFGFKLVAVMPGGLDVEKQLHRRFAQYRAWIKTDPSFSSACYREIFYTSRELLAFIRENATKDREGWVSDSEPAYKR